MKKFIIPLLILLVAATGMEFKAPGETLPSGYCHVYKPHAVILLINKKNMVISGDSITGGHASCIKLINCSNIRITDCKLISTDRDTAKGIDIRNCTNIRIDNVYIANVSIGVYAQDSKRITVTMNDMLNMKSTTHGSFIWFKNVTGGNSRITKNRLENIKGSSTPQDAIDIDSCRALSYSPLYVQGNYIRGGGPSKTGSGINLGHKGGSYQLAQDNILVNPGTAGIVVSGGTGIKVLYNYIYSKQVAHVSYVGLKSGAYSGLPVITGNFVQWKDSSNTRRDTSHQVGTAAPTGWAANHVNAAIDSTKLPLHILKVCNYAY